MAAAVPRPGLEEGFLFVSASVETASASLVYSFCASGTGFVLLFLACAYAKQHFRCSVCIALKHQQYKLYKGRVTAVCYSVAGDDLDPLDPSVCLPGEKVGVRLAKPW